MLRQAPRNCGSADTVAAVAKNNELWAILAGDLADPGNQLEPDLRANLLSLARFSLRHGQAVLAGLGSSDILIDINVAIMKGLRGGVVA